MMDAYILVGGRSSRMGADKAALGMGGSTFLERTIVAAAEAFDGITLIQRDGRSAPAGLRTIFDPEREQFAAIFGLARALEDASARFFLIGADFPLLPGSLLRFLRSAYERSEAEICAPVWDDRPQMLVAGYDPSLKGRVDRAITTGDLRLQNLLSVASTELVPESAIRRHWPGQPLLNVNTPEDLEKARRIDEEEADPPR